MLLLFQLQSYKQLLNQKKSLNTQIEFQNNNKPDIEAYQKFFKQKQWNISHNQTQVQLTKKQGQYHVNILFYARSPIAVNEGQTNQQTKNQQGEQNPGADYTQAIIFISKDAKKWLSAEFYVSRGQSQIGSISFVDNYQQFKNKPTLPSNQHYNGPDINSLEDSLKDKIIQFITGFEINEELFDNIEGYSLAYQHQLYLQWLNEFRALV